MKYANLYWQDTGLSDSRYQLINIGDNLQFFTIDYLYHNFLPSEEKIIKLKVSEVKDYRGETLVLPLNWSLFDINFMDEEKIAISNKIIPVFLAVTIESGTFREAFMNEYNFAYLKQYEPIGCRDAYTVKRLRQAGIKAYLNGCLTSVLPKREDSIKANKVFFVDAPKDVEEFIPKCLKENYEIMTQQYYYEKQMSVNKIIENIKAQYRKYKNEAKLVVTSRMHVASPCMAMGIPVILVKNQIDARFGWIDKYIPIYDKNNFYKINWFPNAVEYEKIKKCIMSYSIKRIKKTFDMYDGMEEINSIYADREIQNYVDFQSTIFTFERAALYLQSNYKKSDEFLYSIWGCNAAAEDFYEFINIHYPQARLKNVIDSFKRKVFHSVKTIIPADFEIAEDECVFVLSVKASNAARILFKEKGVPDTRYVCCGDQFIEIM